MDSPFSLFALLKRNSVLLFFFVYGTVILLNDGFMALDEYWVGITRYIPAQSSTLQALVAPDDVKSPLQILPMHLVAQAALKLGVSSPYWQYRTVIFVLGFLNLGLLYFALGKYQRVLKLSSDSFQILVLMMTFYFAAPFALSRPMFESLAAPWLCLAAVYAIEYDLTESIGALLWGVVFASIAFVLRQQVGFCALVFPILVILKRNYKHLLWTALLGGGCFVLSGIPDFFMRGSFHFSLVNLTLYNFKHGGEYGNQGVLFYPAMIFVLALIPFFLKKYPLDMTVSWWRRQRSLYLVILLFVILHSLFQNKWERFLISLLPLFVLILHPFLEYLVQNWNQNRKRLFLLFTFNGVLFTVASYFPAQKNLIDLSRYLDENRQINEVYRINNNPEWITDAFIFESNYRFVDVAVQDLKSVDWTNCSKALVISKSDENLSGISVVTQNLSKMKEFNVNLIESIAYKFNPEKNKRRVKLSLYSGCRS